MNALGSNAPLKSTGARKKSGAEKKSRKILAMFNCLRIVGRIAVSDCPEIQRRKKKSPLPQITGKDFYFCTFSRAICSWQDPTSNPLEKKLPPQMSFRPMGSSRHRMGRSGEGQRDSMKFSVQWSAVRCNKYHWQLCIDKPSCQGLQLR